MVKSMTVLCFYSYCIPHQEAIAGKCNVVCISKDNRIPPPPDEDIQNADFVCYRFFDVGQHKILDKVDDKIAGIEGTQSYLFKKYYRKFL
jgi:hypothetical protein